MKKTVLLLWIAFLSLSLFANPIDKNTALKIANNFYTIQLKKASPAFSLAYQCTSQAWSVNKATPVDKEIYYYVFNNADKGFIIISGDDATYPVLGYSDTGSYDTQIQATNFLKWMENYKQQIRHIIKNNILATAEIKAEWNNILKGKSVTKNSKTVPPLVTTKWGQAPYVNADCPYDEDAGAGNQYHAVTGCPATAMAQIMKYWNYPEQGKGFHSYNHDKYGTLSANFASTTYDWASMTTGDGKISSANSAVAELMYHCGVGVEMGYGPHTSGSYVILDYTSKPEACSEYAYTTYFDYEITIGGKMREDYTDAIWKQMLKTDLDAKQPIQYAGFGQGGHTFVCDGYDASDYFHFNWGWGGQLDGYFLIDALNPGSGGTGSGAGTYNDGQQAIFGLKPADGSNPGGGGGSTDGFDLRLYSTITANPEKITYYNEESFSVTVDLENTGSVTFEGDVCAALFDAEYNFVEFIETKINQSYNNINYYHRTFSVEGSAARLPGDYYIGIFYRETDKDWIIIDKGSYAQLIPFKIEHLDNIRLYSEMPITEITQNEAFSIQIDIANYRETAYSGSFSVDLWSLEGEWIAEVEQKDGQTLSSMKYNTFSFSTTGLNVQPGTYLLILAYSETGENPWTFAGTGNFTNPTKITVKAPALVGDMYEGNNGNNTEGNAYDLSSGLTKTSTILTTGSNMHDGEDIDYYKIDLPVGYNYTINARVHDSYSTNNGLTYTNDVNWMYLYDEIWSDAYDDVMPNTFQINNGGTLIFSVTSFFVGTIGDYLLDLQVTNDGAYVSGIEDVNFAEKIKIYPIPAKDFLTVDVRKFPAKVNKLNFISLSGKKIKADFNTNEKLIKLPVDNLSNGVFILSIETENGVIQKKVLINK